MNGYFQIIHADNGTLIKLVPPTDGGADISIKELANYLMRAKLQFDIKALNNEIVALGNSEKTVFLSPEKVLPIAETSYITMTPDRMEVTARFYPASSEGRAYGKEDILSDLRVNKVTFGYDEKVIEEYVANKKYCTDYIIAKGIPAREGHDAFITYNFPTDNKARPTLNEDGTVDFFNLNVVNHCKEGDVLAVLTPEDRGDSGTDVMGNVIKPHDVRRVSLSYGLNIDINEARTELRSKVNGHVSLVGGKVFVADVLEVENVDNATGNITYEGNVKINGNVCSNFSVKCNGNIEVKGIVEGAYLEAGGNIILARGINGMGKGTLKSGGNIIAKFLENSTVYSGGYIETESILHSKVQAKTEVNVVSRKGFITGGSVNATNAIRVKTLGTAMGADTEVTVGVDPELTNRYQELAKEIQDTQKNLKMMLPVLEASKQKLAQGVKFLPDQIKQLQNLAVSVKTLQETATNDAKEMETLKEIMDSSTNARVEVTGEVYAGTKITISDVSMIVKDSFKYCRFTKQQGMVKMTTL